MIIINAKYKNINTKVLTFNLLGDIIKTITGYIKIKDLVRILINKISATTSEIIMLAQRGHGGGSKHNNCGHKYSSLRGGVSFLSN